MDLGELVSKGFLGSIPARMARTVPGAFAMLLHDAVYNALEATVPGCPEPHQVLQIYRDRGLSPCDKEVWDRIPGAKDGKIDLARLLTEVACYLEACALREVIEGR